MHTYIHTYRGNAHIAEPVFHGTSNRLCLSVCVCLCVYVCQGRCHLAMVVLDPAAAKTSFQAGRRLAQAGAVLGL